MAALLFMVVLLLVVHTCWVAMVEYQEFSKKSYLRPPEAEVLVRGGALFFVAVALLALAGQAERKSLLEVYDVATW